jgi:hypothetical protein
VLLLGAAAAVPEGSAPVIDGLIEVHRRELLAESGIAEDVVTERGYRTVPRPTPADDRPRQELAKLGIPRWALDEDRHFPGLLIPIYRATGERISWQYKPRLPVHNRQGKPQKYASPKGQPSRLDVRPRNRSRIADPTVPLWVTEGVKKADALTSRGCCVVSVTGVFNWRSTLGTLGDWEDVPLRGREVVVCFDSDARHKPNVARAMVRFGRWCKSKGAAAVIYLIVPPSVNGTDVKGADDYLVAGGTLDELRAAGTTTEPTPRPPVTRSAKPGWPRRSPTPSSPTATAGPTGSDGWHGTGGAGRAAPTSRCARRSATTH